MIFYNYEEVFVMDYSQEYKQKLVSADEAVKLIKSGDCRCINDIIIINWIMCLSVWRIESIPHCLCT